MQHTVILLSEDDNTHIALEDDERITYDQEATLRCEKSETNLSKLIEDVSTETVAKSKVPYCN